MDREQILNHISKDLAEGVRLFWQTYPACEKDYDRIQPPIYTYRGKDIWEQAIAGILAGKHILLEGPKASGKNVLAENLAYLFKRPLWTVSFHVNTDANALIGVDTFKDDQVVLRNGPILDAALNGGFGVLDEINMAKNDAVAVLHSALDHRRVIDVPGYSRVPLQNQTRFIATMNYGYMGTRELNEALTSRFMVISMPAVDEKTLDELILDAHPHVHEKARATLISLFMDLLKKHQNAEISTKAIDIRGLLSALSIINQGLDGRTALEMGLANKCFDDFERQVVADVIKLHIAKDSGKDAFFRA